MVAAAKTRVLGFLKNCQFFGFTVMELGREKRARWFGYLWGNEESSYSPQRNDYNCGVLD